MELTKLYRSKKSITKTLFIRASAFSITTRKYLNEWHTCRSVRARRMARARLWPGVRYLVVENVSSSWWLWRTSKRIWPPLRDAEVAGASPERTTWLAADVPVGISDGWSRWWWCQGLINRSVLSAEWWWFWVVIVGKYGIAPPLKLRF